MATPHVAAPSSVSAAVIAIAAGAVVSVLLGVYGAQHTPTGEAITTFGFESMIAMKVWLGLAAGVLGIGQLLGALWIYGKLGMPAPGWAGRAHRVGGAITVLVSLPVAYHCLWSLGFQSFDTRVLVHSIAGCVVYGAFVTKVLTVHRSSPTGWMLPLAGGLLFASLITAVLTSALWYLNEVGWPSGAGY